MVWLGIAHLCALTIFLEMVARTPYPSTSPGPVTGHEAPSP
jgi:hypothetical protein